MFHISIAGRMERCIIYSTSTVDDFPLKIWCLVEGIRYIILKLKKYHWTVVFGTLNFRGKPVIRFETVLQRLDK